MHWVIEQQPSTSPDPSSRVSIGKEGVCGWAVSRDQENSGGIMMGMIRSPFRNNCSAVQRTVGRQTKGCSSGRESTKTIKPRIEFESWDEEWRYRKGAVRLQSSARFLTCRVPSDRFDVD